MEITFDELNKNITAIEVFGVNYDYLARKLELLMIPSYGIKEAYKNRKFRIKFIDCIAVLFVNTSEWAKEGESTEFITWGSENSKAKVKDKLDLFTTRFPFSDLSDSLILNRKEVKDLVTYTAYMFYNVLGDGIELIASEVQIEEVLDK